LPLKVNFILDLVRIEGSILILLIFQKEEEARTDAKANREKSLLTFDVSLIQKEKPFKNHPISTAFKIRI
jgi:hypothetical protein